MNLSHIDPEWLWLIGGIVLLIAEVIAPGFFLMFVGAAAIATGLVVAASCPRCSAAARHLRHTRDHHRSSGRTPRLCERYDYTTDPLLNNRAGRLLGTVVTVVQPVDANGGRVKVGDGEWSARGAPAAVGERVRIVDIEGNCLKVEPEHKLPPS